MKEIELHEEDRDDLISRKEALQAIDQYIDEYSGTDENGLHNLKWCAMVEARYTIEHLDPAPEQKGS